MTSSLIPTGLRCAHKADPLGVAPDRVRFSATMPMFVLVGFTMRYFVAGLTEGALKL